MKRIVVCSAEAPFIPVGGAEMMTQGLVRALGEQGINVWSGHNYAYEVARHLGLDEAEGVLRIGLAHYNTQAEVERIVVALRRLMR